ncbi:hypothetical protein Goshw_003150 [Gossypium schwendimanii]|uniref:Uncharacterized protein n=1 Tax=Gossypium schwendimanii TaxID=34291 RepID=A0A7J9N885_GOSSC|nr:hypothetical protein [Gossypium schwendimanii]
MGRAQELCEACVCKLVRKEVGKSYEYDF